MTALLPPGRVQVPKSPVVEYSTKTVLSVSSFKKRRKVLAESGYGRMLRSMMFVGDLSMYVSGAVNVLKSAV